jgi:RNA polymerase sigma-70 factor (ECF subfamily)
MREADARDAVLWTRAVTGDEHAFGELFDRHRDRVFGHARRLVGNQHDAEDVTAAAFLELWRRRSDVRLVEDSVLAWLLVTAGYAALNLRRTTRRYRRLLDRLPRELATPDSTEQALSAHELGPDGELGAALRKLRPRDLEIVTLAVLEDMPLASVAAHLGISTEAAKARLHRARTRLRSHLRDDVALDLPDPVNTGGAA